MAKWYGGNDPSCKYKVVGGDLNPGYYGIGFDPNNPNTPTLMKEVNEAIARMFKDGKLQKGYQNGGAYSVAPNNQPVCQKYRKWKSDLSVLGDVLPESP